MNRRLTPDVWAAGALLLFIAFVAMPAWKACVLIVLLFAIALPFSIIERRMKAAAAAGRSVLRLEIATAVLALSLLVAIYAINMVRWGYWKVPAMAPIVVFLSGCMLDGVPATKLVTVHF